MGEAEAAAVRAEATLSAARQALDAIEHAITSNGPRDRRPVIAHAQLVDDDVSYQDGGDSYVRGYSAGAQKATSRALGVAPMAAMSAMFEATAL